MKELEVIYMGGPTMIFEIEGLRFITDPTLDPAGSSFRLNEKMTEIKTAGPAMPDPGEIDVVLLSHDQHFDNLDNAGRELLGRTKTVITTAAGAQRLKNTAIGLLPWEEYRLQGLTGKDIVINGTPARHGPAGVEKITGEVTGFILSVPGTTSVEIYLTGDTTFYRGIAEVAQRFNPNYVFINAGAARPRGPFNVTMGTNDAIDTAAEFPQAIIIPLHAEGWSHYTEHNEDLVEAFKILGVDSQLKILEPGRPTALTF
jgi:L-ascorbate metabolism protein UlaG (beta-lactamase superfamily)